MAGIPPLKDVLPNFKTRSITRSCSPLFAPTLPSSAKTPTSNTCRAIVDTGASPNQTEPVETAAAKEADAKKLKKKHKKL